MDLLQIRNKEYLKEVELIIDVPSETIILSAEHLENIIFIQPGMLYC